MSTQTQESVRHNARYVVNVLALIAVVLALPEFGELVPDTAMPVIGAVMAVLNTVLSWLRGRV